MKLRLIVFFLYQKAVKEILKHKKVENASRESEKRYRKIYHNTPAMLHSIDREGRLIIIRQHLKEWFSYTRDEAIGRKLTELTDKITKTQEKLRNLSRNIMVGQDCERASLSRELHDELGQVLTVVSIGLCLAGKKI